MAYDVKNRIGDADRHAIEHRQCDGAAALPIECYQTCLMLQSRACTLNLVSSSCNQACNFKWCGIGMAFHLP